MGSKTARRTRLHASIRRLQTLERSHPAMERIRHEISLYSSLQLFLLYQKRIFPFFSLLLEIPNSNYALKNCQLGDLALKESSTHCVIQFLKKSASLELNKSDKYLFEANFLAELKSGLKSKVENARHEFITILVEFIKSFQSIFTTYNDLNLLFDEDIEKDFYENIKHIQVRKKFDPFEKLSKKNSFRKLKTSN